MDRDCQQCRCIGRQGLQRTAAFEDKEERRMGRSRGGVGEGQGEEGRVRMRSRGVGKE